MKINIIHQQRRNFLQLRRQLLRHIPAKILRILPQHHQLIMHNANRVDPQLSFREALLLRNQSVDRVEDLNLQATDAGSDGGAVGVRDGSRGGCVGCGGLDVLIDFVRCVLDIQGIQKASIGAGEGFNLGL